MITGIVALTLLIAFLFWWQWGSNIIGIKNEDRKPRASLTGLACGNYARRPVAVMMASDPVARPLSGISQADIVVEMPVTPNGITRMMAIFQCEPFNDNQGGELFEIGSIRSAREDFLTIAGSFGALYVHWGGEAEALKKLNNGILDNINAMKYEGSVFYRKVSIPKPHNGFTTIALLADKAEELGYDLNDMFSGYARGEEKSESRRGTRAEPGLRRSLSNIVETISIDYESPYDIKWTYNGDSDTYKRVRGGEAEIDENTGKQVETNIIVLMHTVSSPINLDYITVKTVGEGEAEFYQNGIRISGSWKNIANDLKFYDNDGQEMKFIPGKMWIEIITE